MDLTANDDSFLNNFNIDNLGNFGDNGFHQQQPSFNPDDNKPEKIQITKRVKSIRQLKKIEVSQVRLSYKTAVLKGLGSNLKDVQIYIANQTGIWIFRSGLEYLKKSEEQGDRKWYQDLMGDSISYVSMFRDSMDGITQLQKELWTLYEDPKTTPIGKIKTIRELHKLTITSTLLQRDLPFITSLTKYYDSDLLEDSKSNRSA